MSRWSLWLTYSKLIFKSVLHHYGRPKYSPGVVCKEYVFGYTISFLTYAELLHLFEEIFIFRVYDFNADTQNPHIIDAGSNIGLSILFFKMTYPDALVDAFEADTTTFSMLEQNIRENQINGVTLYNVALHKDEGTAHWVSRPGQSLNSRLVKDLEYDEYNVVATRKLSSYIKHPVAMLKMDIEGSEIDVLHDLAKSGVIQQITCLMVEFHPARTTTSVEELYELLSDCGFACAVQKDRINKHAPDIVLRCYNTALLGNRTTKT